MHHLYVSNEILCLCKSRIILDLHCLIRFVERFPKVFDYYNDDPLLLLLDSFEKCKQLTYRLDIDNKRKTDNLTYSEYFYGKIRLVYVNTETWKHKIKNNTICFVTQCADNRKILKTCYNPLDGAKEDKRFERWWWSHSDDDKYVKT